jgi:hypothetical protein
VGSISFRNLKSLFKKPSISDKKQKCTDALNGKMEVSRPPKIPICEVHFHGVAVRTATLPLL